MVNFQHALEDCDLRAIPFKAYKFTWDNGRAGVENVKAQLDRAVANKGLWQACANMITYNLHYLESDHLPLLLVKEMSSEETFLFLGDVDRRRRLCINNLNCVE
ncbi:unnamed protein product [Prunus armeniaca]|uniref:Endonuclease/exonuclease/phosphatase domain-containing protein n=1 Tax=Prunus armeniaca TaxID=36596 RepID=A0A6J5WYB8_PRUAR|nr:unnamed protein product [Prunus armeniaca]